MADKSIVVIKFGGNALNEETGRALSQTIAQLPEMGYSPVLIHGGGPQVNAMLDALNVESHFVHGLRYTNERTLSIAEMVLSGQVNKMLVQFLGDYDVQAVGMSGKDGKTLIAEKMSTTDSGEPIDLGFVGRITEVRVNLMETLINDNYIPVIAPIAYGHDGCTYNINADYAAAAIASALKAKHFVMMTNITGLLDKERQLMNHATTQDIHDLIDQEVIVGGMIPKTLSAIDTLKSVGEVNIIDGRQSENLYKLFSGEQVGTRITL